MLKSSFYQTFKLGLKSLFLQKLRASLAALGIFIGTTTVIWLVAMGGRQPPGTTTDQRTGRDEYHRA